MVKRRRRKSKGWFRLVKLETIFTLETLDKTYTVFLEDDSVLIINEQDLGIDDAEVIALDTNDAILIFNMIESILKKKGLL